MENLKSVTYSNFKERESLAHQLAAGYRLLPDNWRLSLDETITALLYTQDKRIVSLVLRKTTTKGITGTY